MAEDLVSRGSLTSSLDRLLKSTINSSSPISNACQIPSILKLPVNDSFFLGSSAALQVLVMGAQEGGAKNGNLRSQCPQFLNLASLYSLLSRISGDILSCGTDIWPWDSHTNVVPKQMCDLLSLAAKHDLHFFCLQSSISPIDELSNNKIYLRPCIFLLLPSHSVVAVNVN